MNMTTQSDDPRGHGFVDQGGTFRTVGSLSSATASALHHATRTGAAVKLATKRADGSVKVHGTVKPAAGNQVARSTSRGK